MERLAMRLWALYSVYSLALLFLAGSVEIKYRYLKALPCSGVYQQGGVYSEYLRAMRMKTNVEIDEEGFVKAEREELMSFFLAPERMIVEELSSGKGVSDNGSKQMKVKNIVPVPIRSARDDIESGLMAAMNSNGKGSIISWSGSSITDRDRGMYDSLINQVTTWFKKTEIKKIIYDSLRLKSAASSPYHLLRDVLNSTVGVEISGLLIEVADAPTEASLSLGAAVLIKKNTAEGDWDLTTENYKQIIKDEKISKEAKLVDCYMDELIGLHFATGIPVVISESLYQRVCIDGLLEKIMTGNSTDAYTNGQQRLQVTAPFFESASDSRSWFSQLDQARARPSKLVPKLSQINDASTFLKMRVSEKRACLRASGLVALPRPREGPKKIDAIMIPLLDEEVAYEVLRRLGETKGDFDMAAEMNDFESVKPKLARQIMQARREGDSKRAEELCNEINLLGRLGYDPSNPDAEVTKEGFDIEEWYWEQRKRVYGIIA